MGWRAESSGMRTLGHYQQGHGAVTAFSERLQLSGQTCPRYISRVVIHITGTNPESR